MWFYHSLVGSETTSQLLKKVKNRSKDSVFDMSHEAPNANPPMETIVYCISYTIFALLSRLRVSSAEG